jgi:hypothetical protein
MVYIGVLALAVGGLVVVVLGHFRAGLTVMGGAMLLGAVARLAIPGDRAGMLGIRRKLVDVTTLVILGGGLLVLAVVIPDAPPT